MGGSEVPGSALAWGVGVGSGEGPVPSEPGVGSGETFSVAGDVASGKGGLGSGSVASGMGWVGGGTVGGAAVGEGGGDGSAAGAPQAANPRHSNKIDNTTKRCTFILFRMFLIFLPFRATSRAHPQPTDSPGQDQATQQSDPGDH